MSGIDSREGDQDGTMVVDSRGRVGIVVSTYVKKCRIQFQHTGAHATLPKKSLRLASQKEIDNAGWTGYKSAAE